LRATPINAFMYHKPPMVEPRRGGENESQQHKSSTKV
jgi:hypothetical protein